MRNKLASCVHIPLPLNVHPNDGSGSVWKPTQVIVCRFTLQSTPANQAIQDRKLVFDPSSYVKSIPLGFDIDGFAASVGRGIDQSTAISLPTTTEDLEFVLDEPSYVLFALNSDLDANTPIPWQFRRSDHGMDMGQALNGKYGILKHLQSNNATFTVGSNSASNGCRVIYFEATTLDDNTAYDHFTLFVEFLVGSSYITRNYDPDIKNDGHKRVITRPPA